MLHVPTVVLAAFGLGLLCQTPRVASEASHGGRAGRTSEVSEGLDDAVRELMAEVRGLMADVREAPPGALEPSPSAPGQPARGRRQQPQRDR